MLNELISIVNDSGMKLKKFYNNEKTIKHKGAIDLVTEYDVALENILKEKLSKAFPDFTLVGEESSSVDVGLLDGKVIYIDPIDGTTNFVHRFPFVCTSIGAFINGEPYCGVVNAPILGELYSAVKGGGAHLNGNPIKVSSTNRAIDALFAAGFSYEEEYRNAFLPIFTKMMSITRGARRAGSAALDLCYLARGTFDVYIDIDIKPWDMAAGIVILTEAGGKITDLQGNPCKLTRDILLASNSTLHDTILNALSQY